MSSELSVIPPLVGGFWFVIRAQILYLISLQLGQAITLLMSALIGVAAAICARIIVLLFSAVGWQPTMEHVSNALWPAPLSGTALGALLVAFVFAEISHFVLQTKRVNTWVVKNFAGDMIRLLHDALLHIRPVRLSLESRKVYVGFVQGIPSLDPSKAFVRLLPIISGYRDDKTLDVKFTTYYGAVLKAAERTSDFVIVIPLASIKTARFYDPKITSDLFKTTASV